MSKVKFNVTYDIVTPESAEYGDVDDSGFVVEAGSLRDAVRSLTTTRTEHVDGIEGTDFCERSVRVINNLEYFTGACESRTLHIPRTVTNASAARIRRLLGGK